MNPNESQKGHYDGTFIIKELVYTYVMWISPVFHLKVVRAFDTLQTQCLAVAELTPEMAFDLYSVIAVVQ